MYWNNPIETVKYPSASDVIFKSQHQGQHCLFYNPQVPVDQIAKQTQLHQLCDWANHELAHSRSEFTGDPTRHYDAANLVKINQMVHSVRQHGSVKPMLLFYTGSVPYATGTGDTRLRAIERVPAITHVSGIISTHSRHRSEFAHLREIHTLEQFAQCFDAPEGSEFLIRLTDAQADWGMDWYEYVLNNTSVAVPNWTFCLSAIQNYIMQQPDNFEFTVEWFDQAIVWADYARS
jgi:hypothetical protein